jgi:hypothetical protein
MKPQFSEEKLIEIFCSVDDLYKAYLEYYHQKTGTALKVKRCRMSCSEVVTISICYHLSGYKNFEYFYQDQILGLLKPDFPTAVSYERFVQLQTQSIDLVSLYLFATTQKAERTGMYFIDSKKIASCHIKREHSHKVMKDVARKGKTSSGWFYGLKTHLVINNIGQIVAFDITPGNVSDNNHNVLRSLLKGLDGVCCGDKGYQSALFEEFYQNGLHLLTKPKKNQRAKVQTKRNNKLLSKRAVIESTFNICTYICDIEHSRHRNKFNAVVNILAGLAAYQNLDNKPSIFIYQKSAHNYQIAA